MGEEISQREFFKYSGTFILSLAAVVGVAFGLNSYFLTIREHTEYRTGVYATLQRLQEVQDRDRPSRAEFNAAERAHEQRHIDLQKQVDVLIAANKLAIEQKISDLQHQVDDLREKRR